MVHLEEDNKTILKTAILKFHFQDCSIKKTVIKTILIRPQTVVVYVYAIGSHYIKTNSL